MDFFHNDINAITENNLNYRMVLATTPNTQLVIMSLVPREEIGMEIHPYVTQFIRIESGEGLAIINNQYYKLLPGVALLIPLNTWHNITNTSFTNRLQLYTLYSPPNHPRDTLQITKPVTPECSD